MSQVSSQLAKKDLKGRYPLGISSGIFGTFEDDFQRMECQNRIGVLILFLIMVETKMIWFLEQSLPFILKKSLRHALSPSDSETLGSVHNNHPSRESQENWQKYSDVIDYTDTFMCRKINDVVISGTLLLDSLLSHLTTPERENCKAVYLHVLTTNFAAMKFYDKRHFKQFRYLPLYYAINGIHKDGFSYVLYINGGEPPWTLGYPL